MRADALLASLVARGSGNRHQQVRSKLADLMRSKVLEAGESITNLPT
jgi:hypothetical protein